MRERIIRGAAHAIHTKGFAGVTVLDIAAAAGVSRRTFYKEFRDKTDAFTSAYEYAFEQTIAACAPAFFSSGDWPERVWASGLAFTGFLAREPEFAHLGFVNCYATGRGFQTRAHDTQLAFTLFLQDGYKQRATSGVLREGCSALTAATIFETAFQACRIAPHQLRTLQPLAVYIALTPFIGASNAGTFITYKLNTNHRAPKQT